MYSHMDREDMASIEVTNESGSFKFIADGNGSFYIEGHQGTALDSTMVSSLVATCGSPLSKTRVMLDASDEKLEEYGLKTPKAHWIITDNDGKQYKVYVGRELLTGGGYYCSFAGRGSVYVLDTSLANTILKPKEAFVTPYIIFGVSQNDYYTIDNFTIYHGKEKFLSIGKVPEDEQSNPEALAEHILTYPAPYSPESEVYLRIYMDFASFTGDETYKLGITEQDLIDCGLDEPSYTVSFDYGGKTYYFMLKEADEDSYFAVSGIYGDIITKISKSNIAYLDYDLIKWVSPYVFRRDIKTISSVSVKSAKYDETFHLVHSVDEEGAPVIQVRSDSGHEFTTPSETMNFRQYYGDLISLAVTDYLPAEAPEGVPMEEFLADPDNLTMTVSCVTTSGEELSFDIYRYSTRRCAIRVGGRFDFCILNDVVELIESDTEKLLAGEKVQGSY